MDACNAVEKELDKLLGRFSVFRDSLDKLDELINHVKETKNSIDEGMWQFLSSDRTEERYLGHNITECIDWRKGAKFPQS